MTLSGQYGKPREEVIGIMKKYMKLLSLSNMNQLPSVDIYL